MGHKGVTWKGMPRTDTGKTTPWTDMGTDILLLGFCVVHVFVATCMDRKSRKSVQGVLLNFMLFSTLPLAPEAFWKCLTNLAVRCWRLLLLLCVLEFSVQVLEHVLVTFPCVHDFLEQTQRAPGHQTPFVRNTSSPQLYH